jgi:hypothetical protein
VALSSRDYRKYLKFASADLTPPTAEELTMARFIFADNLIGRSQMTWAIEALDSIAERLIGMPFTVNHDWDEVEDVQGVIYDATRLELSEAPSKFVNNYAAVLNKKIIRKEGWMPVVGKVAFRGGSQILEQLAMGAGNKVSIGGFRITDIWCPTCNCSFNDRTICTHVPPHPWYEDSENTAPYTIRKDVCDMGECSLVLIPNAPSAGAITNDIADYFKDYV